ncbi:MAG: hypothetical protein ACOYIK_09110 [Coriobacteriales bacterium]
MKYKCNALMSAILVSMLIWIPCATGCSAKSNPNEIETEPNSQSDELVSGNEGDSEDVGESGRVESVSGLVANEMNGFAVWARGKLSVSTGESSDDLVFEVDPNTDRTRAWTNVEVDGNAVVSGNVRSSSISTLGGVEAGVIDAATARLGDVETDNVEAESLSASDVRAESASAGKVSADEASLGKGEIAELVSGNAKLGTTIASSITSEDLTSGSVDAAKLVSENVESGSALFGTLSVSDSLFGNSVVFGDVNAGSIESGPVSADSISAGEVSASNVEIASLKAGESAVASIVGDTASFVSVSSEKADISVMSCDSINGGTAGFEKVEAGDIDAQTAEVDSMEVTNLTAKSAGVRLDTLCIGSQNAGLEVFDGTGEYGSNANCSVTVAVPTGTDFIIVTPTSVSSRYVCSWEVADNGDGTWSISRRFSERDLEEMHQMQDEAMGECAVYWMAVSVE